MKRGEVWWAALADAPRGSEPGYRRPVVIVSSDDFNRSEIRTVVVATITTNLRLAGAPGNVRLSRRSSRLPTESVVNVSQLVTLDKLYLQQRVSHLTPSLTEEIDTGLRLSLALV
jgi:mRNA interferase MazF